MSSLRSAISSIATVRPRHAGPLRRQIVGGMALLLIASTLLVAGLRQVGAQNASPTAAAVKVEVLGQVNSTVAPDRVLILQRRTFPPGSESGVHPAAGPVVLYVDSGSVVFSITNGAAIVTRAGSTTTESVASGNEVTLATGDEISYDEGVVHDVSNPGSEQAVTLESRLNPLPTATPTS